MSFIRSVGDQWHKAQLANRLLLTLAPSERLASLCTGATDLNSLSHLMAALVFHDGRPAWLHTDIGRAETPLTAKELLNCLLLSCQLLCVRAVGDAELRQSEQLIVSLAETWVKAQERNEALDDGDRRSCAAIAGLAERIRDKQLEARHRYRNMTG